MTSGVLVDEFSNIAHHKAKCGRRPHLLGFHTGIFAAKTFFERENGCVDCMQTTPSRGSGDMPPPPKIYIYYRKSSPVVDSGGF